jgi:hypothetical protein
LIRFSRGTNTWQPRWFPEIRKKAAGEKMMAHDPSNNDRTASLRLQIDENLRRIYHTMLEDAVPERFTRLLQQLRDADRTPPPPAPEAPAASADAPLPPSATEPGS